MASSYRIKERTYKSAYYAAHREEILAKQALDYTANRAERLVKMATYREAHLEELRADNKAWRAVHREEDLAASAAWRAAHLEQAKANIRAWHAAHPEKVRANTAKWKKSHPEMLHAQGSRRRAAKRNAPINDFTVEQWVILKEQYKHRCAYCRKKPKKLTMDHIQPLSKGGSHTLSNIVPACGSCNSRKHDGAVLGPVQPLFL